MTIASDIDLRHPLVMDYDRFVVAAPRYANQLACIHGVGGSGPRCGSLARADTEDWMTLSRGLVEYLFAHETPNDRRWWFCQNCIASRSHPLFDRNHQLEVLL